VRNLPDGMVEVVAEGRKPLLDRLVEFCKNGPQGAHVDEIEIEWLRPTGEFEAFNVMQ
jgi:acylphosphatase